VEADLSFIAGAVIVGGEDEIRRAQFVDKRDGIGGGYPIGEYHVDRGALSTQHAERLVIGHVHEADARWQTPVVFGIASHDVAARHRHGDGGRSDIGADLEDGAALKGFHKEIEKRAIGISGRSASEPVPCP
jgi:hypothetical protein